jgi:ABC-type multidrug transport system fused ATPase/permease subunit
VYKATNEALSSVKYIKVRGVEKEFVNSFCVPSKKISSYNTMNQMMTLIPRYILEVIVFGGMILIVMVSSTNNPEVIPIMSLYAMAGYRLMPAIQSIYTGIVSIRYNISAFNMMTSNLSEADATIDLKPKPLRLIFNNKIEMEDIEYMYLNAKTTTINKINLTVKHNTTVGIIGTTGSGKTTLVDILLGLLSPNSGHIKIDGIKLNNNNISAWQDSIGYVPQSINLIDGTIRNNVAFGVPNNSIDDNQVIRALKIANMYDFVSSLDDGCDTLIGEKGVRLSGGQQQRIGIAMALYNNPSVLILDEATSSLDSITENTIMDTIHNLSHKKTIVMIAHRLSTVKECDIIYMMDKGKIIASGTYQQMSDSNESFRAMLDATI